MLEIEHVSKRLHLARVVVKHQQHARVSEDDEQVKRDPAHSPGIAVAHRITIDLGWMQMQEHVREHAQGAVARRVVVLMAEDRRVDLGLRRILQACNLLLRLGGDVGLQRLDVVFHSSRDFFQHADFVAVFPVRIVFVCHK